MVTVFSIISGFIGWSKSHTALPIMESAERAKMITNDFVAKLICASGKGSFDLAIQSKIKRTAATA